jgi:hypothetical protein
MSSKKQGRKSLSDSGTGKTYSDLDDLKRDLSEKAESDPETSDGDSAGGAAEEPKPDTAENKGSETIRMTFHIDRETAERLRNAVYWTGAFLTLSGTARDALRDAVEEIEAKHNDGEPFPPRDEDLKGGNPELQT